MQETQSKEVAETQAKRAVNNKRPYKFYAVVTHKQVDIEGKTPPPEFLSFEDKAGLRAALDCPKYDAADFRIVRGYEMNVKARRQISIN